MSYLHNGLVLPDDLSGLRDKAILLIGFAGAFRRSEIVGLQVRDVQSSDAGLIITLRRSKTDQEGASFTKGIPIGTTGPVQNAPWRLGCNWLASPAGQSFDQWIAGAMWERAP